jgi:hypothetical protein
MMVKSVKRSHLVEDRRLLSGFLRLMAFVGKIIPFKAINGWYSTLRALENLTQKVIQIPVLSDNSKKGTSLPLFSGEMTLC